jgi:hypothetical protein
VSEPRVLDALRRRLSSALSAGVLEPGAGVDKVGGVAAGEPGVFVSVGAVVSVDEALVSTGTVEVELTKGSDCSMYVPFGCSAYCPTSRSPLVVS